MFDKIVGVYEKEDDIFSLISQLELKEIDFDNLIKPKHFYYSIDEKGTDLNLLKTTLSEFNKIKLVCKRKHKNGKISYDFYYELDDGTYIFLNSQLFRH